MDNADLLELFGFFSTKTDPHQEHSNAMKVNFIMDIQVKS